MQRCRALSVLSNISYERFNVHIKQAYNRTLRIPGMIITEAVNVMKRCYKRAL